MNQPIVRSWVIRSLMILAFSATMSSFSGITGADSFKVYLNDKLLLRQYVMKDDPVQSINLGKASDNDMLNIHYDHCGRIGTGRVIMIKDPKNNLLREWHFQDAKPGVSASAMACRVSEIKALQKTNRTLSMVYSSRELKAEKMLASIVMDGSVVKASKK